MHSLFKPNSKKRGFIVLTGLDGTGKSTQGSILAKKISTKGTMTAIIWNRWNPRITAPLIAIARRHINSTPNAATEDYEDFTTSKQEQMQSPLKRNLWQFLVWGEYLFQVYYRLLSAGYPRKIIISDRYVYDTLIDIAINFSIPPSKLNLLCNHKLLSLFPRPACVLFLDIDPEVGFDRKKDGTPVKYLADRRPYYIALANLMHSPVINCNEPLSVVADNIESHAVEWIHKVTLK